MWGIPQERSSWASLWHHECSLCHRDGWTGPLTLFRGNHQLHSSKRCEEKTQGCRNYLTLVLGNPGHALLLYLRKLLLCSSMLLYRGCLVVVRITFFSFLVFSSAAIEQRRRLRSGWMLTLAGFLMAFNGLSNIYDSQLGTQRRGCVIRLRYLFFFVAALNNRHNKELT